MYARSTGRYNRTVPLGFCRPRLNKLVGRALASSGPDGVVARPEISAPHPLDLTTDLWVGTRRSWTRSAAGGTQICGSGGADLRSFAADLGARARRSLAFLPKISGTRAEISGQVATDLRAAARDLRPPGADLRHAAQDLAPFGRQIRSVLLHLGRTLGRAVWPFNHPCRRLRRRLSRCAVPPPRPAPARGAHPRRVAGHS